LRARRKEKDTVRAKAIFLEIPFRYGGGRTGNDRVFARCDGRNDDAVSSNVRTRQDTSLEIKNTWASAPRFTVPTKVQIPFL
jgi:hypothetical protein